MCQLQLELVQLDCIILLEATFIFLNLNNYILIDTWNISMHINR